jgi:hypothetical protein
MIPYDQLVSALTSWRQRNGLPTLSSELGVGDTTAAAVSAAPMAYAGGGYAADDEGFPSEHTALSADHGDALEHDAEPIEEIDDGVPRH